MIEAIMYFALGFLAASLIALVLLSAVWRRAIRLATRRAEADFSLHSPDELPQDLTSGESRRNQGAR